MTLAAEGAAGFAPALIQWQRHSGRHGLPWQGTRDPYRVWLSEIMLQQTQVSTVLGYYDRFLRRFPDRLWRLLSDRIGGAGGQQRQRTKGDMQPAFLFE